VQALHELTSPERLGRVRCAKKRVRADAAPGTEMEKGLMRNRYLLGFIRTKKHAARITRGRAIAHCNIEVGPKVAAGARSQNMKVLGSSVIAALARGLGERRTTVVNAGVGFGTFALGDCISQVHSRQLLLPQQRHGAAITDRQRRQKDHAEPSWQQRFLGELQERWVRWSFAFPFVSR